MNISSIRRKTLIAFLLALTCENTFGENFPFNSNKKSVMIIIMSFVFLFLNINVKIMHLGNSNNYEKFNIVDDAPSSITQNIF